MEKTLARPVVSPQTLDALGRPAGWSDFAAVVSLVLNIDRAAAFLAKVEAGQKEILDGVRLLGGAEELARTLREADDARMEAVSLQGKAIEELQRARSEVRDMRERAQRAFDATEEACRASRAVLEEERETFSLDYKVKEEGYQARLLKLETDTQALYERGRELGTREAALDDRTARIKKAAAAISG